MTQQRATAVAVNQGTAPLSQAPPDAAEDATSEAGARQPHARIHAVDAAAARQPQPWAPARPRRPAPASIRSTTC